MDIRKQGCTKDLGRYGTKPRHLVINGGFVESGVLGGPHNQDKSFLGLIYLPPTCNGTILTVLITGGSRDIRGERYIRIVVKLRTHWT